MWKYFWLYDNDNSGFSFVGAILAIAFFGVTLEFLWEYTLGKIVIITFGVLLAYSILVALRKPIKILLKILMGIGIVICMCVEKIIELCNGRKTKV